METEDTLEYNREHNEFVEHRLEFEVSGPSSTAFPTVPEGLGPVSEPSCPNPATADAEESDDSDDGMMAEETSDSSDEDGDTKSKAASKSLKRKSNSANGETKKPKMDQHVDEIPED